MKPMILLTCLLVALSLPAGVVYGSETKDHICFSVVDADNNGEVNYAEYQAYFGSDRKGFEAADLDKNGTLSHDEYHERLGHGTTSS